LFLPLYPSGITANVAGALEGEQIGDGVGVPVAIRVRLPEVRVPVFCRYCHWVMGAVLGIIPSAALSITCRGEETSGLSGGVIRV